MRQFLHTLLVLFFIGTSAAAQNPKIDSVSQLILQSVNDLEKARLYFIRSKLYLPGEIEKTMADAQESLALYQKAGNPEGQVDAMVQVANVYARQNKYDLALETSREALQLARKHDYIAGQAFSLSNIGRNQAQLGNMADAEAAYNEAIVLMKQSGNDKELGDMYNRIGILNFRSGRYYQAISYLDSGIVIAQRFNLELPLAYLYMNKANNLSELSRYDESLEYHILSAEIKERLKDDKGLLQSYNNMGNLYNLLNRTEDAVTLYRKSIRLAEKLNQVSSLALGYSNLAIAFEKLKKTDSISYLYEQSIRYFEQIGDKPGTALSCHNYGNFLLNQNQLDLSGKMLNKALTLRREVGVPIPIASTMHIKAKLEMKKTNWEQAEKLLTEALDMAGNDNSQLKFDILQALSDFYKLRGDYEKALFFKDNSAKLKDTLITENKLVRIEQIQKAYEISLRENQLLIEKQENEIQRLTVEQQRTDIFILTFLVFLFIAAAVIMILAYVFKAKYARELLSRKNQVEMLNKEIHHRARNNLQIVSGLLSLHSRQTEDDASRKAIDEGRTRLESIAMIHQRLYDNDNLTKIEMNDYIGSLAKLLEQSFGVAGNISTKVSLADPMFSVDYAVPVGLMVNELVTNAFKYAASDNPTNLKITIELNTISSGKVHLRVADNGSKPVGKFSADSKPSFGVNLVKTLVKQIKGTMFSNYENGLVYHIEFPMK